MPVVIKLGSNVATDESGALRDDVLESICDQIAELHEAGDDVVIVTSGAIARGMQVLGLAGAPDARWPSCRRPRPSGRASSTASTTSCCARTA